MGAEVVVVIGRWGTWEELLLGGAVLRHGTRDWAVVAAELRARTACPFGFTPEVCKAKYEDLQHRYSGCTAWFEELRKRRMAELRQALEKSEGSIGSLESKLESLRAEKGDDCHVDYGSSQTEYPVTFQNSEAVASSGKEMSKDGLSAGSFTQEICPTWSLECQYLAATSSEELETKPVCLDTYETERISTVDKLVETVCGGQGTNIKKKRGKRKRKDCSRDVKEGSAEFLDSADLVRAFQYRENSTSDRCEVARSSGVDDNNRGLCKMGTDDLMGIFDFVVENGNTSVFHHRLDGQKRGRYKKMIRQHMDFETIRSRIVNHAITSDRELFRDLLLLTNNALVFYSKNTREHKAARLLRDLTTRTLRQHYKDSTSKATNVISSKEPATYTNLSSRTSIHKPPVKPRSVRPVHSKLSGFVANARNAVAGMSNGGKKLGYVYSPPSVESVAVTKKGHGRPRKVGRGTAIQRSASTTKGRKRVRTR